MRKILLTLIAIFLAQVSFADMTDMSTTNDPTEANSKNCETIANACLNAGFTRMGSPGKMFWHDCMKPVLMGKTVSGVTINNQDIMACRQFKIQNLKDQLQLFQSLPTNTTTSQQ